MDAVVKDNTIYFVGGVDDADRPHNAIFTFNAETKNFSTYTKTDFWTEDVRCCLLKLPHATYMSDKTVNTNLNLNTET